jgi:nitrogen regulatory protein PII
MKLITSIVNPARFEMLKKALWKAGHRCMTVTESQGYGEPRAHQEAGQEDFMGEMAPRLKVEVAVRDEDVEAVSDLIVDAVRTGRIGDGKVFISSLDQVVRVRTGERGNAAL